MKKYIFRREKILPDRDVWIMSERMKWPVDCDGREAFFPDGKWEGYVDNPLGYRAIVYQEWCEVVEENEDAPAAVDAMKAAIMDSMMLALTNIVEQADALIVQLARLKGAIK